MEKVTDAQDLFDTLPADIRENYQQDFTKFVESIDRGDVDELVSMGVLRRVDAAAKTDKAAQNGAAAATGA